MKESTANKIIGAIDRGFDKLRFGLEDNSNKFLEGMSEEQKAGRKALEAYRNHTKTMEEDEEYYRKHGYFERDPSNKL